MGKLVHAAFRVDASVDIGSGHFMRCLSLARALVSKGVHCTFVCRDLPGHMAEHSSARQIDVVLLPLLFPYTKPKSTHDYAGWLQVEQEQDAQDFIAHLPPECDLVIVDHYALDSKWELKVRAYCDRLVVIDDLCRMHAADYLIDQTLGRDQRAYSESDIECVMAGEQYALLRPEYYKLHEASIGKQTPLQHHLLISMGGYDALNITGSLLELLAAKPLEWLERVDVVLAASVPHYDEVRKKVEKLGSPFVLHDFVRDFGRLMSSSTLAIGAAGTTTWERAACGLPSILVPVAENQASIADAMDSANAAIVIKPDELSQKFRAAILSLRDNWDGFARASLRVTDGLGCRRVLQRLLPQLSEGEMPVWLDMATEADITQVYEWQQIPEIRRYARNPQAPAWDEHMQWMQSALADPGCYFYMVRRAGAPVGIARLNRLRASEYEVSILLDPAQQGQGLGNLALSLLSDLHREIAIHATVLEKNTISQQLFKTAGYTQVSQTQYVLRPRI